MSSRVRNDYNLKINVINGRISGKTVAPLWLPEIESYQDLPAAGRLMKVELDKDLRWIYCLPIKFKDSEDRK